MDIKEVQLNENEIQLLMNDPEIRPEESLQNLVSTVIRKANRPLHPSDLIRIIINIGYYEAHNKEIPLYPQRSLKALLRQDRGIRKFPQELYGLTEWPSVPTGVIFNEEADVSAQAVQEDSNNMNNKMENLENEVKNCPKCHKEINIRRHFCPYCAADLFKFCSKCLGEIEKDDAIFCADCSTKLEQRIRKSTCV